MRSNSQGNSPLVVREVEAKSILNASKIHDYCINPYTGCGVGCVYCCAALFMRRYSGHTLAELRYGVAKSQNTERNRQALEEFLLPLEVADFDESAASAYGTVRADLENAGRPIGPLDTQISAHAQSLGVVLVTDNTAEFRRIKELKIENWLD